MPLATVKSVIHCYLDVDDKHPRLFGDAILPRDEDGMGFSLELGLLKGKYVQITIELADVPEVWTD